MLGCTHCLCIVVGECLSGCGSHETDYVKEIVLNVKLQRVLEGVQLIEDHWIRLFGISKTVICLNMDVQSKRQPRGMFVSHADPC